MAEDCTIECPNCDYDLTSSRLIADVKAEAVAAERERCAKIADDEVRRLKNGGAINTCRAIAAAIRRE